MVLYTNLFSILCFLIEIFSRARAKGNKRLNGFKSGTFTGRFPSDGMANMAVKGIVWMIKLRSKLYHTVKSMQRVSKNELSIETHSTNKGVK